MTNEELKKLVAETIDYLRDYYLDWQDYIERFSFPRLNFLNKDNIEISLYYILKSLTIKINFNSTIYNNILFINNALNYNDKILKENEKYKKTN